MVCIIHHQQHLKDWKLGPFMARFSYNHCIFGFISNVVMRDKFFSNTNSTKLLSYYVAVDFLYWKTLLFLQTSFSSTQFLCLLICLSLEFSVAFHLALEFCFFGTFSDAVNAGYREYSLVPTTENISNFSQNPSIRVNVGHHV